MTVTGVIVSNFFYSREATISLKITDVDKVG